jgi:hypothetical protein
MSHMLELNHDEAKAKAMSISLKSNGKMVKAFQVEDEVPEKADVTPILNVSKKFNMCVI